MPYILKSRREELEPILTYEVGDLNYYITKSCLLYLETQSETYKAYNEVIGVLECVKQEIYRRRIAPYEDKKKKLNGDVF